MYLVDVSALKMLLIAFWVSLRLLSGALWGILEARDVILGATWVLQMPAVLFSKLLFSFLGLPEGLQGALWSHLGEPNAPKKPASSVRRRGQIV